MAYNNNNNNINNNNNPYFYPNPNDENNNYHAPPPFPSSAYRPESPRVLVSSQDDRLIGSPSPTFLQGRNLTSGTPVSTAPNSPMLPPPHQRPYFSNSNNFYSANQSTEHLLPGSNSRSPSRNTTRSDMSDFDYEGIYGPRPGRYFNPPSGRSSPFVGLGEAEDDDLIARPVTQESRDVEAITEKFTIIPSGDLLVYPNDVEADDPMHNPDPKVDRKRDWNIFSKRGMTNCGGLFLILAGLGFLFIGYPVLFYVNNYLADPTEIKCIGFQCLDAAPQPLMKNMRSGLIDPDTPQSEYSKKSSEGKNYELVFSDEFNVDGRTFYAGDDPFWEAVDLHYAATVDLEWYDPDMITTKNGALEIKFAKHRNHDLDFRSGMLQSWNKLCFKGGILEASISLPGRGDVSGLWPGFWTMGNLARPGYLATTEGMWPYSYHDKCDFGITPNQSSPDGISWLPGMKLPACTCSGEDHPNPGKSRSAPEIDIIESTVLPITSGQKVGVVSQSNQVAPFDIWYQPNYDFFEIYQPTITDLNTYRGGPYQQAMSVQTVLNNEWYEGKEYQRYGFDYEPGSDGFIAWNIGKDNYVWKMTADSMGANGNIGPRPVSNEPMSIIMNVGMSESFAQIEAAALAKLFPATMRVDWVRIYQPKGKTSITCDPPGYETTQYIADHPEPYANVNLTTWAKTGYGWPQNTLMNDCKMK